MYHGTIHTLTCIVTYDSVLVDSTPVFSFVWTLNGTTVTEDAITVITTINTDSVLGLSPVNHPSMSSGDYACTVTLSVNNSLILSSEGTHTLNVDVQGIHCVNTSHYILLYTIGAPLPVVQAGLPVRPGGRCEPLSTIPCTANVIDTFATQPVIMWLGPDSQVIDEDAILNYVGPTGDYRCIACANITSVGLSGHCSESEAVTIQDVGELV